MEKPAVYVAECAFGKGVFALHNFESGEDILRLVGKVITREETISKGHTSMNPLQISPLLYIDLEPPGVYFNHSCVPNAAIQKDVFLIALRPIKSGEEICYDYSTTIFERRETMNCQCGTPRCRKVIGDFDDLPLPLQKQYLEMGVVQSFICQAFSARL